MFVGGSVSTVYRMRKQRKETDSIARYDAKEAAKMVYLNVIVCNCKSINNGSYLIWQIFSSRQIDWYLNCFEFGMFSVSLIKAVYIGGYFIWQFLGVGQIKCAPNINRFAVCCYESG